MKLKIAVMPKNGKDICSVCRFKGRHHDCQAPFFKTGVTPPTKDEEVVICESFEPKQDRAPSLITPKDLKSENYYWLVSADGERTLVYCYRNPDTNWYGFGFNTADGSGFLPASDLNSDTEIYGPVEIPGFKEVK